jgi:hypothetical protein
MKAVTEQQIARAEAAFRKALERRYELGDRYTKQVLVPQMRERIGKCYEYYNGGEEDGRWWLFVRITDVDPEGRHYRGIQIEKRPSGRVSVEIDVVYGGRLPDMPSGYTEIDERYFAEKTAPILAEIAAANNTKGGN